MSIADYFEQGYGLMAVRWGLMSPLFLSRYDMYKTYLEHLGALKHLPRHKAVAAAKKMTQVQYDCDYWMVRRAIILFESDMVLQISVNGHS